MAEYRLGIRYDPTGAGKAKQAAKGVTDQLERTSRQAQRTGRSFSSLAVTIARVAGGFFTFAAGTAALRSAGRVIADFDRSMSTVAAITRATSSELSAMTDIARELGATTEFTAAQAADGMKFLGMAGFSAAESIAAIPETLDLATAGALDLSRAADIASNIMSGFSIAATDAASVTDVMAAVASRSNTSIEQLGDAMKFVAPVASAMNVSIGEAAAAIGILSDAGLQGSLAGTGLRRVMSGLANPTKEAEKVIASMGLTLEEVNPATNDLADVVELLASKSLSAAEALTIFGDRGGPAILALTAQVPGLRALTAEMSNAEGEASRMAATMRDNLRGDLDTLTSAISELVLSLGDAGLRGALRSSVQAITEGVRAIAANMDRVVAYMQAAGLAALGYTGYVVGARIATVGLTGSLVALRGILLRLGIPAIIIGIGELIYQFDNLVERVGGFGETMGHIDAIGREVFGRIGQFIVELVASIEKPWLRLQLGILQGMAALQPVVNAIGNAVQHAGAAIVASGRLIADTFEQIKARAEAVFWRIDAMVNGALSGVIASFERLKAGALGAFAGMVGGVGDAVETIVAAFQQASDPITAVFTAIPRVAGMAITGTANTVIDGLEGMLNLALGAIEKFTMAAGNALRALGLDTEFGELGEISLGRLESPEPIKIEVEAGDSIPVALQWVRDLESEMAQASERSRNMARTFSESGEAMSNAAQSAIAPWRDLKFQMEELETVDVIPQEQVDELAATIDRVRAAMQDAQSVGGAWADAFDEPLASVEALGEAIEKNRLHLRLTSGDIADAGDNINHALGNLDLDLEEFVRDTETVSTGTQTLSLAAQAAKQAIDDVRVSALTYAQVQRELDRALRDGAITSGEYAEALRLVRAEFDEAFGQARDIIDGIRESTTDYVAIQNALNEMLREGTITANEYAEATREVAEAARNSTEAGRFWNQTQQQFTRDISQAIASGRDLSDVFDNLAQKLAAAAIEALLFGSGPLANGSAFGGVASSADSAITSVDGVTRSVVGVGTAQQQGQGITGSFFNSIFSGAQQAGGAVDGLAQQFGSLGSVVQGLGGIFGSVFGGLGGIISGIFGGFFSEGGVVPGRKGEPKIVLAHGGERILPVDASEQVGDAEVAALRAGREVASPAIVPAVEQAASATQMPPMSISVNMPDISIPEMDVPEITLTAQDVVMPDMPELTIDMPSLDMPDMPSFDPVSMEVVLQSPEFDIPEITMPELNVPEISVGELTAPNIDMPTIETPRIEAMLDAPEIDMPEMRMPEMPDFEPGEITARFKHLIEPPQPVTPRPIETVIVESRVPREAPTPIAPQAGGATDESGQPEPARRADAANITVNQEITGSVDDQTRRFMHRNAREVADLVAAELEAKGRI